MSKPLRQRVILELLEERSVSSQEDLQRALSKRGLKVGQATLSRDIHELGLVKTGAGYMLPVETMSEPALPPVSRLVREFVLEVRAAPRADMYPAISGNGGYPMQPLSWTELQRQKIELLFLATPHEISRALVPEAIARDIRVVDLSGAWRLRQAQNRAVYGFQD